MSQKLAEAGSEAAKASPPIAVLAVSTQGMTLQDWVLILTLIYLVAQISWLLWRWWRAATSKDWRPND